MSELAVPPGLFTAFPSLTRSCIEVTSPRDPRYNCVAWAAGESFRWWWPDALETCYWPPEVPREESLEAFVRAFGTLGYETCADGSLDSAYEKLAIFASRRVPTHVARQLADGNWTSKLGKSVDLSHFIDGLDGEVYGAVVQFMCKTSGSTPRNFG